MNPSRPSVPIYGCLAWAATGLLLALTAGPLLAGPQESAPPSALPGVFGETVEVRVVNIEVVVTDKQGTRVHGLGPEAFRLLVDGEEVPIDYFTEVRGGAAIAAPQEIESVPAVAPGRAVGTSYLVFIDDFFSIGVDRDRVLKALEEDLDRLGPEDRMAIVAWDGRQLEMLSSWTSSTSALRRALEAARRRPALGLQRRAERRRFDSNDTVQRLAAEIQQLGDASGRSAGTSPFENTDRFRTYLDSEELFYAHLLGGEVDRSVRAAAATLRGFAAPPGRKVMLLLSGGWPFLPAEFVAADISRALTDRRAPGGGELFRPLTDTANQIGYTLYPVDVPGLDRSATEASAFQPLQGRRGILQASEAFLREQEVHYSLEFLASETGGEAFLNGRRTAALEGVVEDTRSYYWLGFSPQWQGDDAHHDIRVEVRDPKLKVRSREGFVDSSRSRETTMEVESALLFGNPPSAETLRLEIGRPRRAGIGKMEVPVAVIIPLDKVTFVPSAGHYRAELELRVAVIDARGERAEIPVIPVILEYRQLPPEGKYQRYETILKMRRRQHQAVVAIYDPLGGRMLSGTAEIAP